MPPVKSFLQRLRERAILRVPYRHADPGHRLQKRPLPAYRTDKREHSQDFANPGSHD